MNAYLSDSKKAEILAAVQANPEIGTANAAYVNILISRAADHIVGRCQLPRYPELAAGFSMSQPGATEDISGLTNNQISVSVNGTGFIELELTLANCTSGAATAAELQTQIQAESEDGWDEVTVAFASTKYTITSGRYGELSTIKVAFDESTRDVARAMLLSPTYGGEEATGMDPRREADGVAAALVEIAYRKIGIEGTKQTSVPGDMSAAEHDLDPRLRDVLAQLSRTMSRRIIP